MKLHLSLLVRILLVLAVAGCASNPTGSSPNRNEKFRYAEKFIGKQKWVFAQQAPRGTSELAAKEHLVYRVSDVAIFRGFDRFIILGYDPNYGAQKPSFERGQTTRQTSSGEIQVENVNVYNGPVGTVTAGSAIQVQFLKPGQPAPAGTTTYDAKTTREQMIRKYPYLSTNQWIDLR